MPPTLVQAAFTLKDYKTIDATVSTKDAAIRDLLAMAQVSDVTGTGVTEVAVTVVGVTAVEAKVAVSSVVLKVEAKVEAAVAEHKEREATAAAAQPLQLKAHHMVGSIWSIDHCGARAEIA